MIQLYDVTKRYGGGAPALDGVTLRVREGEMVFLTGPSGAGKSTLLRLLLCVERADAGQILIGGRNIHALRDASVPFLRRNFGVVFQDFRLLGDRDVRANIALGMEILGLPRRDIERRVDQLLQSLALEPRAHALPRELSGGEAQRVAIARALVNEPAILLCDEPTGNLDAALSRGILDLLCELNRRGTTVVVATHDEALIAAYGCRALALEAGRLVGDTPRRDDGADLSAALREAHAAVAAGQVAGALGGALAPRGGGEALAAADEAAP
jgi:cell division transport system ATP-binding protein